ncbi:hypothetical protein BD414DRAFT_488637 [Trametes punicea]|nr:hypothetical protein BD414DRAFT_488637 [Trametes punicea]
MKWTVIGLLMSICLFLLPYISDLLVLTPFARSPRTRSSSHGCPTVSLLATATPPPPLHLRAPTTPVAILPIILCARALGRLHPRGIRPGQLVA